MFGSRINLFLRSERRTKRAVKRDIVVEQVKKVLEDADQKLILMARG